MHIAKCNRPYLSKFRKLINSLILEKSMKRQDFNVYKTPPKIHTLSLLDNCYLNVCLKVISLYGAENLPKSSRFYNEMHKLYTQPFTQIHHLYRGSRIILKIKNSQIHYVGSWMYVDVFKNWHQKRNDCVLQMFLKTMAIGNYQTRIAVFVISKSRSYCSHCHIIFTVIL